MKRMAGMLMGAALLSSPATAHVFNVATTFDCGVNCSVLPANGTSFSGTAFFPAVTMNPGDSLTVVIDVAPPIVTGGSWWGGTFAGPGDEILNGGLNHFHGSTFMLGGSPITELDAFALYSGPAFPGSAIMIDTASFEIFRTPELSTWAMMALGFGGLGLAGWRSRRRSVSIAA